MEESLSEKRKRMFPGKMYCEGRHKPKFRGIVHFAGTSVIIPLSIMWTCVDINTRNEFIALIIFFTSQFLTWGTSALFHCLSWNLEEEINIQRLDHSAIFVHIASSYTPAALILYDEMVEGKSIVLTTLIVLWILIALGVWHIYNRHSERMHFFVLIVAFTTPSYFYLAKYMTFVEKIYAMSGILIYGAGAVIFSKHLMDFLPHVFGYHEIFHVFTVIAGLFSFLLMKSLAQDLNERCLYASDENKNFFLKLLMYVFSFVLTSDNSICNK